MLVIENQQYFDEVVAFAKTAGLYENKNDQNTSLKNRLDYLEKYGGKGDDGTDRMRVRLRPDGAPYSFSILIETKNKANEWELLFNGGLLFHGAHDGHGSGAGPTFACTLSPTTGWSIHT